MWPENCLILIPARAGSKGIPGKNWKRLGDKPLIQYSLEQALQICPADQICVSSDADEVLNVAQAMGLPIPFKRPAELSGDHSGSREVLIHALDHYQSQGRPFDYVVLLQATSPFRTAGDIAACLELLQGDPCADAAYSVAPCRSHPYYTQFREDDGALKPLFAQNFTRRQDLPEIWELNGSIYAFRSQSLRKYSLAELPKRLLFKMPAASLVDLDTEDDWMYAEFLLDRGKAYL